MVTNWYIVPTKEALALGIPDVTEAGDPPYMLIDLEGKVVVFDFNAMLAMIEGFNNAVVQLMDVVAQTKIDLLAQKAELLQDGDDAGS